MRYGSHCYTCSTGLGGTDPLALEAVQKFFRKHNAQDHLVEWYNGNEITYSRSVALLKFRLGQGGKDEIRS